MDINKEIIMTIIENSKGRLEYDQEFFEINEEQLALISNKLTKLFSLHGVVSSLPESKDRILELEKAIVSWNFKNDINDKQAFTCGWNNCYRWIKDFVRQQR